MTKVWPRQYGAYAGIISELTWRAHGQIMRRRFLLNECSLCSRCFPMMSRRFAFPLPQAIPPACHRTPSITPSRARAPSPTRDRERERRLRTPIDRGHVCGKIVDVTLSDPVISVHPVDSLLRVSPCPRLACAVLACGPTSFVLCWRPALPLDGSPGVTG